LITVARAIGLVFARCGQPAVLGEILAGISSALRCSDAWRRSSRSRAAQRGSRR
jgi:hypothetical protein